MNTDSIWTGGKFLGVGALLALSLLLAQVVNASDAKVYGNLTVGGLLFTGDTNNTLITKPSDFPFPWTTSGQNIYYNGGNVGIGVLNPVDRLEVAGSVKATAFVGNGSGLTGIDGSQITGTLSNATVPGSTPWQTVNGNSQQAASNTGYVATGATLATLTLPVNPAVGDVVRVSSPGSGGFTLAANTDQTISVPGVARDSVRYWQSVASSADGSKLVAVVFGGQIYTSTDSGTTWTPRDSVRNWHSVTSSADGSKLVAVAYLDQIYTSTDSGVTWTPRDSARRWRSVASSADGIKLVAVNFLGQIYASLDSGVTWSARESARDWYSVASSADGSKLVAGALNGRIYTSTDSGVTWTPRDSDRYWYSVASSADGSKLVAVDNGGQIYTSTDSGVTWIPRDSARNWYSVASSADGSRLVAVDGGGQIYFSLDSGVTWAPRDSAKSWNSVASSADGSKLVVVVKGGQIYTWDNALHGAQNATVELVYAGAGAWTVLGQSGMLYFGSSIGGNASISGNASIAPPGILDFGSGLRQSINLWSGGLYGIGIQNLTQYFRIDSADGGGGFAWYKGGVHSDIAADPGSGGTKLMQLERSGNLTIAGTLTQSSDARLKTDIQSLDGALTKVLNLRGVSYALNDDAAHGRKIGVIAQEVEQEYPELVATDGQGMKSVAYANLTAVLIEAVKALKAENDALKVRLERLEQK